MNGSYGRPRLNENQQKSQPTKHLPGESSVSPLATHLHTNSDHDFFYGRVKHIDVSVGIRVPFSYETTNIWGPQFIQSNWLIWEGRRETMNQKRFGFPKQEHVYLPKPRFQMISGKISLQPCGPYFILVIIGRGFGSFGTWWWWCLHFPQPSVSPFRLQHGLLLSEEIRRTSWGCWGC